MTGKRSLLYGSRRRFIRSIGAGAAATGLAGCLGDDVPEDAIRFGALAVEPNTNPLGQSIRDGVKLAAKHINADGGLLGNELAVFTEDTQQDAARAREAYENLVIGDEVDATIGPFSSEELLAIIDKVADEQKLHFTCASGTTQPSKLVNEEYERYKYHFRPGPHNGTHVGQTLVDFAGEFFQDTMGWDRIAVLAEDAEWTKETREVLREHLPDLGVEIADFIEVPLDTSNFRPIYSDLEDQDIDGVYTLIAHTGETAVAQWYDQKRPFGFGGVHVPSQFPFLWEQLDGACEFAWTHNAAIPGVEITETTTTFVESFKDEFGATPVYTGFHAYDSVLLYAAYAEHVGTTDPEEIIPAMEMNELDVSTTTMDSHEFYGPDAEYAHDTVYDKDRWMNGESMPIFHQWQDGDQVTFASEALADGEYQSPDWI